ncbi:MAG: SMI1/KNR4 family protein [Microcoleus sp.]
MYLEKFKARFAELQHLFPYKLLSCTEEQIHSLERQYGLTLPMAYKQFLLWGGVCAGGLFEGSNYSYDDLSELREGAEGLLERDEFPEPLPKDAFVLMMHQGYIFWLFKTSEGDDPPVYGYEERDVGVPPVPFKKISSSFSKFLEEALEEASNRLKRLQE